MKSVPSKTLIPGCSEPQNTTVLVNRIFFFKILSIYLEREGKREHASEHGEEQEREKQTLH